MEQATAKELGVSQVGKYYFAELRKGRKAAASKRSGQKSGWKANQGRVSQWAEGKIKPRSLVAAAIKRANAKLSYPERAHKLMGDVNGKPSGREKTACRG